MLLVGLTGGIASGKSTVVSILKSNGIPVIDADDVARLVVLENDTGAQSAVARAFGSAVLKENGSIDREALGDIVFSSADKKRQLEKITHPRIALRIILQLLKIFFTGHHLVVLDLPLLFEVAALRSVLYRTLLVDWLGLPISEEWQQRERLMQRNGFSQTQAQQRLFSQLPMAEKRKLANIIIDNRGSFDDTRRNVSAVLVEMDSWRTSCRRSKINMIFLVFALVLFYYLMFYRFLGAVNAV